MRLLLVLFLILLAGAGATRAGAFGPDAANEMDVVIRRARATLGMVDPSEQWTAGSVRLLDDASPRIRAQRLGGDMLGSTDLRFNDLQGARSGTVTIALYERDGAPLDREKMDATLVHEAGHVLGLVHTRDETSVMHPRSRATVPSSSDVRTVLMLYRLPFGHVGSAIRR